MCSFCGREEIMVGHKIAALWIQGPGSQGTPSTDTMLLVTMCVCGRGGVCSLKTRNNCSDYQPTGEVPFSSEVEGRRERNVGFLLVHFLSCPGDGGIFPWREHWGQTLFKYFTSQMWQETAEKWSGTRGIAENIKERQREGHEASPFGSSHEESL